MDWINPVTGESMRTPRKPGDVRNGSPLFAEMTIDAEVVVMPMLPRVVLTEGAPHFPSRAHWWDMGTVCAPAVFRSTSDPAAQ